MALVLNNLAYLYSEKFNDMAKEFQASLAERIGAEAYEKLTGLKSGQTVNLIDPSIMAGIGIGE